MITSLKFKRFLHVFSIAYIIIGFLYFYMLSDFSFTDYSHNVFYHSFDKGLSVLLMLCIACPCIEFKKEWLCICCFFLLRLLWEALAIKDYVTASRPSIIFCLFLADILCTIIIFLLRIKKTKAW